MIRSVCFGVLLVLSAIPPVLGQAPPENPSLDPVLRLRGSDGFAIDSWSCAGDPSCEVTDDVVIDATDVYSLEVNDGGQDETGDVELLILCLFGSCPTGYYPTDLVFTSADEFAWSPTSDVDGTFDVVQGNLDLLRESGGDFSTAVTDCLSSGDTLAAGEALDDPGPSEGLFVLARAVARDFGPGSYDTGRSGQMSRPGGRDDGPLGIDSAAQACPGVIADFVSDDPNPGPTSVNITRDGVDGDLVTVSVNVTDTSDVFAASFDLVFDPAVATFVSWSPGTLLEQDGTQALYQVNATQPGRVIAGMTRQGTTVGVNAIGTQPIIRFQFRVDQIGSSSLSFESNDLLDDSLPPQPIGGVVWTGGTLTGS